MSTVERKIAFFVPTMGGGGAERVMLELATEFVAQGCSVDLLLVRATGPYLASIPESIRVVDLKAQRTLKAIPALVRYLRRERPDAVMSTIDHANIVLLCARVLARVPVRIIVREASSAPWSPRDASPTIRNRIYRVLKRWTYARADKIVAVSQGVKKFLQSWLKLPENSIEVIYNPVNAATILRNAEQSIDHPWFHDESRPVILAVGRLDKHKDYHTLLQAFAEVRHSLPARLLVLGEGDERSALETEVENLGLNDDVSFPGFVDNPFPYMARAAVLVMTSRYEGLPNVLIQALVLGSPVVSTDCQSGPSEILEDGRYGRLVPVGDSSRLARELIAELRTGMTPDRKQQLIDRGRSYTMEKAFAAYRDILLPDDEKKTEVLRCRDRNPKHLSTTP